ncbi:MAG TPA: hypothetical protein VGZ47_14020 [Gemmataceae bacterium]|jgi:hypothetical protein|nr:hypothetical protein [Gemmataceae bacterium]
MRRSYLLASVLSVVLVGNALGLATETKGNEPFSELNYDRWKGIMPIVNDKARVYHTWANGNEHFFYKGTTKELNTALGQFAKIEAKNRFVILRPGPGAQASFDKTPIPFNWEMHLLGGLASTRANDRTDDLYWYREPVLTVYVGGDIDLSKIEVPKGVTLRAAPVKGEDSTKNAAAQQRIVEFVDAWRDKQRK